MWQLHPAEFRSSNVFKIAVIYRADVLELRGACEGIVAQAKSQLLTIMLELQYVGSNDTGVAPSSRLAALMDALNDSPVEALVMCGLQAEASEMARMIDQRRKPLKAIVFTNGPYARAWNDDLGNLSVGVLSFAHWAPDLSRRDDFWEDSTTYAGKYKNLFHDDATYLAAAASATGYVLHSVLSDVFRGCILGAQALADPSVLLFTSGAIACTDNNNRGHDRLIAALSIVNMNTFFGSVNFNRFRQNQGYLPVTLQTYEISENLKTAYKPSLVLPLSTATRPLLLPQQNRYAPTCQPGTYRGEDVFLPCIPCSPGHFQEYPGRTSCEMCPRDFFANASALPECLSCPTNTLTNQRGSTNLTDCVCQFGFFSRNGLPGEPCEPCPANAVCEGGTILPSPLPGFYAEPSAPFTMYRCNPSSVCAGNFTCKQGYRGRMCARCYAGHFRFLGNCVTCPRYNSNVLGYLVVLATLWILVNVWLARAVENLMIIINFCQLMSIVVGFSLNWPSKLYQVMSLSSILSFEMDSLEPSCLVHGWDFAHNLVIQLLMPLIMALLVFAWIGVTCGIYKVKQAGLTRSVKEACDLRRSQVAPWKQVLWELLDVPQDLRELQDMVMERCAIPMNFLNIGFLVQFKYNLSTFSCTTINGVQYMSPAPNDVCYTGKHWNLMMMGLAGLVVYNFGFVCLYGHVMRELRRYRALGDRRPLLLYGWMYERYEAQYCWYETVTILQRIGFVLVSLFVNDPGLQAVLCLVLSIAVLLVDIRTSAYMDKHIAALQAVMDGVLCALLVAGLLFYNPLSEDSVVHGVEILLFSAVVIAFAVAVLSIFEAFANWVIIKWLMSKHRPLAERIGQRVKGYRHVYYVFGPLFLFNWLRRCSSMEWNDWHRLCAILIDYVHPTSEVSYLSLKKAGRFWRYLLDNFPETIDYLVSVNNEEREHFNTFIEGMYDHFFDSGGEHQHQVYYYINDKYKAAFAQWLSSCEESDRKFCQDVMKMALGKVKGVQAASELCAAMNRSHKIASTVTVLSAVDKFKRGTRSFAATTPKALSQAEAAIVSKGLLPPRLFTSGPSLNSMAIGNASVRFRAQDIPDISLVPAGGSGGTSGCVTPAGGSSPTCSGRRGSILKLVRLSDDPLGGSYCTSESGLALDSLPVLRPPVLPEGGNSFIGSLAAARELAKVAGAEQGNPSQLHQSMSLADSCGPSAPSSERGVLSGASSNILSTLDSRGSSPVLQLILDRSSSNGISGGSAAADDLKPAKARASTLSSSMRVAAVVPGTSPSFNRSSTAILDEIETLQLEDATGVIATTTGPCDVPPSSQPTTCTSARLDANPEQCNRDGELSPSSPVRANLNNTEFAADLSQSIPQFVARTPSAISHNCGGDNDALPSFQLSSNEVHQSISRRHVQPPPQQQEAAGTHDIISWVVALDKPPKNGEQADMDVSIGLNDEVLGAAEDNGTGGSCRSRRPEGPVMLPGSSIDSGEEDDGGQGSGSEAAQLLTLLPVPGTEEARSRS